MKYKNGSETILSSGPWSQQLVAVRRCLCEDGNQRYVQITGQPDSFSSIPARTKVKGKTVSGYLTYISLGLDHENVPLFVATRKHKHLIPREYMRMLQREYYRVGHYCLNPKYEIWDSVNHDYR